MSGCGCSSAEARREVLRTSHTQPDSEGGYRLLTYPDCTTLYSSGPSQGASIVIVGRYTEAEKLFVLDDVLDASEYAIANHVGIENLPTTALCHDAVVELLGA